MITKAYIFKSIMTSIGIHESPIAPKDPKQVAFAITRSNICML